MRIKLFEDYLKKFNESVESFKELEFNEDMMYQTSMILNLVERPYERGLNKLGALIKTSLSEEVFLKLFRGWEEFRDYSDLVNIFISTVINHKQMKRMFNNVVIHEGADGEDEYVAPLEINGKIVLILHSPERGSSLRIQDDNHTIKFEEVLSIVETLCKIYNEKLSQ
jgi:hypothetical protein